MKKITTGHLIMFLFAIGFLLCLFCPQVLGADYDKQYIGMRAYNVPSPYIVTNSSANGANNQGWGCFDNSSDGTQNATNEWQPASLPAWVMIYLGPNNASKLTQYEVCTYNSASYRPTAWNVTAGNTSTPIIYLDSRTGQNIPQGKCLNYTINNNVQYTYFMWNFTASSSTPLIVDEIKLYFNTTNAPLSPPTTNYITTPCNRTYTYGSGENINITYTSAGLNITYSIFYSSIDNISDNNIVDTPVLYYIWDYTSWADPLYTLDNGTYYIRTTQSNPNGENASTFNASCLFNICKNEYVSVNEPCTNGLRHLYYRDINNCSIPYFLPDDNDTYVNCTTPAVQTINTFKFDISIYIHFLLLIFIIGFLILALVKEGVYRVCLSVSGVFVLLYALYLSYLIRMKSISGLDVFIVHQIYLIMLFVAIILFIGGMVWAFFERDK